MSVKMQEVERKIITAAAGFSLNTTIGGEDMELPEPASDRATILGALFAGDEDRIYVYTKDDDGTNKPVWFGWVWTVYGNDGWDVISDYTVNLEQYVGEGSEAYKLSEHYGA